MTSAVSDLTAMYRARKSFWKDVKATIDRLMLSILNTSGKSIEITLEMEPIPFLQQAECEAYLLVWKTACPMIKSVVFRASQPKSFYIPVSLDRLVLRMSYVVKRCIEGTDDKFQRVNDHLITLRHAIVEDGAPLLKLIGVLVERHHDEIKSHPKQPLECEPKEQEEWLKIMSQYHGFIRVQDLSWGSQILKERFPFILSLECSTERRFSNLFRKTVHVTMGFDL